MKKVEFNYKKGNINMYIVAFFSIIVSTALFLNIQKELYMSYVYLGMGIVTFISILSHVKKSKKAIHSITFRNNSVIVDFKHTIIEPLEIDLSEINCETVNDEINLRDKNNEILLTVELANLKRKEEKNELLAMFK